MRERERQEMQQGLCEEEVCPAEYEYESLRPSVMLYLTMHKMIGFIQQGPISRGGQKQVVSLLGRYGGMSQQELLRRSGVRPGSLSEVLGKLEHTGLIRRTPNPDDRRSMDIALTEKGEEAAAQYRRELRAARETMFDVLDEEEQRELLHLLEKLCDSWEKR